MRVSEYGRVCTAVTSFLEQEQLRFGHGEKQICTSNHYLYFLPDILLSGDKPTFYPVLTQGHWPMAGLLSGCHGEST